MHNSNAAMKTIDAISMKSGLRRKQEKKKRVERQGSLDDPSNVFKTRSMISISERRTKVLIRRASELCFEEPDSSEKSFGGNDGTEAYDSLDLMFGTDEEDSPANIPTVRQLVKDTVIVEREKPQRVTSKSTTYSSDGKRGRRRAKSIGSMNKKMTEELEELVQSASEIFEVKEDARQDKYLTTLLLQTYPYRRSQYNMRIYYALSGTYLLDIIQHESQPHQLPNGTSVQIFYGDMNIKRDKYEYKYTPPPPPDPFNDLEETVVDHGLQHLLHVKVPLPKNVVYFEPPVMALWNSEKNYWTSDNIHHFEIDNENHFASFSLSKVLPFAFLVKKYSLLPYVSWNLKPSSDGRGVGLTIQSALATIKFHVLNFSVSLEKAEFPDQTDIPQVQDIVGKYLHLHKLIEMMKSRGVNVFPDEDACIYTETTAKDVVLEDHTNLSIALWSDSLEFQSCEWNGDFRRRKLAFRVREHLEYMDLRYRTIVTSSLSAKVYRLGVEDTSFDESKVETYGFCPDALSLLEKAFVHVTPPAGINPLQVLAVYALLCRTKPLSYSGVSQKETPTSSSEGSKRSIKRRQKKSRQKGNKKATDNKRSSVEHSGSLLASENSFSIHN